MKKKITIIFTLSVLIFFNSVKASNSFYKYKTDTLPTLQLIPYLQQMPIDLFIGKPIDTLLSYIPSNFYNIKVYPVGISNRGMMFNAGHLFISFTPDKNGPSIALWVNEFTHMNRYSPNSTWDATLFRKENIFKIQIWKDQNHCIIGDCSPY